MSQNLAAHPSSHLSVRAVTGGFLVTIATFVSLLALVAVLSGWTADLRDLSMMGAGFWVGIFAAWVVSVYAGGFVASRSITSRDSRNGILNSTVAWAASSVFTTWILMISTNEAFNFTRNIPGETGTLRVVFFGNALAVVAAVLAGIGGGKVLEMKSTHAHSVRGAQPRSHG